MNQEEFGELLTKELREFDVTVRPIPPKKESSDTREVQFLMVNHPRSQPTSPSESSDTQVED